MSDTNAGMLLEALTSYYSKYKKIPTASIMDLIVTKITEKNISLDKHQMLNVLKNSLSQNVDSDKEFIKDLVFDFLKQKAMYYAIIDNLDDIDKKKDVTKIIERFNKIAGMTLDSDLGLDYFKDLDQHFIDICKIENKVSFQYSILDEVTHGGITRGEKSLNVLAAPPGLGKSMFLANFATNYLSQGLTVFIISLEMSDNMYASRIDAHLAEHNINELKFHPEDCKTKIRSFADLHPTARLVIKDWPPGVINTAQIKVWLDKYKLLGINPDILIVDYMNLMQPNYRNKNANSYEKVGDIGRELRALSFDLGGIPVLTATQFNRSGINNTDPNMSNISESMATAATADFLGALWQNDGDVEAGKIQMNVLKNRWGGKVGTTINFEVDYNTLRVLDAGGQINGGGSGTSAAVGSSNSIVDDLINDL